MPTFKEHFDESHGTPRSKNSVTNLTRTSSSAISGRRPTPMPKAGGWGIDESGRCAERNQGEARARGLAGVRSGERALKGQLKRLGLLMSAAKDMADETGEPIAIQ